MTRQIKRTKKGRFAKGTGAGPGHRSKKDSPVPSSQEIRDAFYKAFVEIFVKGGSVKELVAFCKKSQLNQRLLLQEVRKILPEIAAEAEKQSRIVYMLSEKYMPEKDDRVMKMTRPGDEKKAPVEEPKKETPAPLQTKKKKEPLCDMTDDELAAMTDDELDGAIEKVEKEMRG